MKPNEVKKLDLDARELIKLIKGLPESKQEFINGYVQGLNDAIKSVKPA